MVGRLEQLVQESQLPQVDLAGVDALEVVHAARAAAERGLQRSRGHEELPAQTVLAGHFRESFLDAVGPVGVKRHAKRHEKVRHGGGLVLGWQSVCGVGHSLTSCSRSSLIPSSTGSGPK